MRSSCPFMVCCICMSLGTGNPDLLGRPKSLPFEIVIGPLIATQAVLFSTSPWHLLASECQETRMIKWWWWWGGVLPSCPPAVYVCCGEEVFLPAWPMAGLSWQYHNASQYLCNNNITNNNIKEEYYY